MTDSVPPEPGSLFAPTTGATGGLDGYYDEAWVIAEMMCWMGHTKGEAETYLEEQGGEQAIEAIQTQIRP